MQSLHEVNAFTSRVYAAAGGLGVIRCTVMDPFMGTSTRQTDHVEGFAQALKETLGQELGTS